MTQIPDSSVDLILCDLPYGTTNCRWDSVIPFAPLWNHYKRIAKPKAAIVLTACQPFTTALISSNLKDFKYCWVWNKTLATGHLNAKKQPLRNLEDIVIFCGGGTYNPQMTKGTPYNAEGKGTSGASLYNNYGAYRADNHGTRYPTQLIKFKGERGLHPTQKPVTLMEYLIKTYTNRGDLVLDNCMGSGSTGVACINTGRNFIGIEQDDEYFQIARDRIDEALNDL